MTLPFISPCNTFACQFDPTPTTAVIIFEVFVVLAAIIGVSIVRRYDRRAWRHFLIVAIGIFIFEFFTHPLWLNEHMGRWAYVYRDVSWVLTLGWSTILFVLVKFVDTTWPKLAPLKRFGFYLLLITPISLIGEMAVVNLGLRNYSPESLQVINNHFIGVTGVPWSALYYIPIFMALCIGFMKYWIAVDEDRPVVPLRHQPWLRRLFVSFAAVFLYEMMIEPMVTNAHFPAWSYIYRDVSVVMSGLWVLIIWLALHFAETYFLHWSLMKRFAMTLGLATIFFVPVEGWLIHHGYRVYGPSAAGNMTGLMFPFTSIPLEVVMAIPFYLTLVISFVRYIDLTSNSTDIV